jgi:hypothetical protein
MSRGKKILYNELVENSITTTGEKSKRNNGIDDRRDAMAHRYYFYANINRLRYDDCLLNLQKEFYLQPDTIVSELKLRLDLINQLITDKITTAELRKKYSWFNWMSKLQL